MRKGAQHRAWSMVSAVLVAFWAGLPHAIAAEPGPDLAVSASSPGFVPGTVGSYSVTVTNIGDLPTQASLELSSTRPAVLTFDSAAGAGWTCALQGQAIVCQHPGPLLPGDSATVTLAVVVPETAPAQVTFTLQVETAGDTYEPNNHFVLQVTTGDPPAAEEPEGPQESEEGDEGDTPEESEGEDEGGPPGDSPDPEDPDREESPDPGPDQDPGDPEDSSEATDDDDSDEDRADGDAHEPEGSEEEDAQEGTDEGQDAGDSEPVQQPEHADEAPDSGERSPDAPEVGEERPQDSSRGADTAGQATSADSGQAAETPLIEESPPEPSAPSAVPPEPLPNARPDHAHTAEDQAVEIDVLANDTAVTGTVTISVAPAWGTATVDASGIVLYRPSPDFHGLDVFAYSVDGQTASVSVVVTPVNDAPVAGNVTIQIRDGETAHVHLLESASDPDGDGLTVAWVTQPVHGSVTTAPDGGAIYRPDRHYVGDDSFGFQICDVEGACDVATVRVAIVPVNELILAAGITPVIPTFDGVTDAPDTVLPLAATSVAGAVRSLLLPLAALSVLSAGLLAAGVGGSATPVGLIRRLGIGLIRRLARRA